LQENCDTQAAISTLCRLLRCKPNVFGYAGTKDKRAVTVQSVTAFRVRPQRLANLNAAMKGNSITLGNFRPAKR
jgi:tRNA pseudouridine13 synthase